MRNFILILGLMLFSANSAEKWSFGNNNYAMILVAKQSRDKALQWAEKHFGLNGLKKYNIRVYRWKNNWYSVALLVNVKANKSQHNKILRKTLSQLKKQKKIPSDSYVKQSRPFTQCYGVAKTTEGQYAWIPCQKLKQKN